MLRLSIHHASFLVLAHVGNNGDTLGNLCLCVGQDRQQCLSGGALIAFFHQYSIQLGKTHLVYLNDIRIHWLQALFGEFINRRISVALTRQKQRWYHECI